MLQVTLCVGKTRHLLLTSLSEHVTGGRTACVYVDVAPPLAVRVLHTGRERRLATCSAPTVNGN